MTDPKNSRETFVVDRLDRLRIVGDAKARIARAARVVIFERERLQIGVKIGAQLEQRLQTDFHEDVICDPIDDSPKELNDDQRETENRDEPFHGKMRTHRKTHGMQKTRVSSKVRNNVIDNDLEGPRLKQIQCDSEEGKQQSNYRLRPERSVITKDAPIDRHVNLRLRFRDFRLNYGEFIGRHREIPRLRPE